MGATDMPYSSQTSEMPLVFIDAGIGACSGNRLRTLCLELGQVCLEVETPASPPWWEVS